MLAIGLALISAAAYGSADFLVGLAARRSSAAQANLAVYAAGTLALAACAALKANSPSAAAAAKDISFIALSSREIRLLGPANAERCGGHWRPLANPARPRASG